MPPPGLFGGERGLYSAAIGSKTSDDPRTANVPHSGPQIIPLK